jgi:plasmid stabilization system protein ParE
MTYRVEQTDRAARDLRLLFVFIHAGDSAAATRWFNGIEKAMETLGESPQRCPIAAENRRGQTIRQLLYGRKPHVYRILFRVKAKDRVVSIIHVRHGARLPATERPSKR